MKIDVIRNAKKNAVWGAVNKIVLLICPFIERYVIQLVLGSQYLGLGSLYASIITVLSLSELGFSSAMVYNMYKPAAEGDVKKINALLNFYKKTYKIIGCVVLGLGLVLIPFLPRLIKGSYPDDISLIKLYLIYLLNAALSYFLFAYLTSVIVVHQREDVNSSINSIVKAGLTVSEILILLATRNYYYFTLLLPVFTILNNLLLGWRVHKLFPQYRAEGNLSAEDRAGIKKLVAGTFIQQACGVTRNSLDSIFISAFLGLTLTAIYNNYYQIMNGSISFLHIIIASFIGGIGNHVATRTVQENYNEMRRLDFLYLWLAGWAMISMLCLYQPFMILWMGKDMLLPMPAVILICLYFYLLKLGDVRSMYSTANGLWWEQRYRALSETILNLVLNLVLGKLFGVYGIILATIISLFLCNYIWSVGIVFRLYFSIGRRRDYYMYQGKQSIVMIAVAILTYLICISISFEKVYFSLVFRAIVCFVVPNTIFYLVYRKTDNFKYVMDKLSKGN